MDKSKDDKKPLESQLPLTGKGVFVRNDGRDRFAYQDTDGVWRDYYSREVLKGEVT